MLMEATIQVLHISTNVRSDLALDVLVAHRSLDLWVAARSRVRLKAITPHTPTLTNSFEIKSQRRIAKESRREAQSPLLRLGAITP